MEILVAAIRDGTQPQEHSSTTPVPIPALGFAKIIGSTNYFGGSRQSGKMSMGRVTTIICNPSRPRKPKDQVNGIAQKQSNQHHHGHAYFVDFEPLAHGCQE